MQTADDEANKGIFQIRRHQTFHSTVPIMFNFLMKPKIANQQQQSIPTAGQMQKQSERKKRYFLQILTDSVFGSVELASEVVAVADDDLSTPDVQLCADGHVLVLVRVHVNRPCLQNIARRYRYPVIRASEGEKGRERERKRLLR